MRLQKRNIDNNLNYFTHDSYTELIIILSQKYELRFYHLIYFQLLTFRMFDSKIKKGYYRFRK